MLSRCTTARRVPVCALSLRVRAMLVGVERLIVDRLLLAARTHDLADAVDGIDLHAALLTHIGNDRIFGFLVAQSHRLATLLEEVDYRSAPQLESTCADHRRQSVEALITL